MKVYLNGKFVAPSDASVSPFDAAFQHGVGLFETMHAYNGRVFRLDAHMHRLAESAQVLGLTEKINPTALGEAVQLTVEKSGVAESRIRLTMTGGDLSLLAAARSPDKKPHHPTVFIQLAEPTVYPDKFFSDGVTVTLADPKVSPFDPHAGHKTLNYWARLRSLVAASQHRAGESLWFSTTNHLVGGAVSNCLIVKNEQIYTPIARGEEVEGAIPSPVLPGITRAAIIEIAERLDIPVHKRMLTINDVLEADEVMLTNSSWLVLPVVAVEKKTIAAGTPGVMTKQLHQELMSTIERETTTVAGSAESSPKESA
jgi:branched-subunit amino acid aminotransferase/4-amino-4-deoxychorismate lyase